MVVPYQAFFNAKNPLILTLWKLGYSVVPVRPNKRPLIYTWQQYQRDKPAEFEIRSWAGRFGGQDHNYAIVTGNTPACRHQLVVVDADDLAAVEFCDSKLPQTLTVSRCRGKKHYYFRRPDVTSIQNRSKVEIDGTVYSVDLRADGGLVIMPGSVHESGDVYQASQSIDAETLANLPVYDPAWLGWSLVDDPVERTKVVRDDSSEGEPIKASGDSWQAAQAAEWLTRWPGSTAGDGAGKYALRLAMSLVHGFSLDADTAHDLLLQWGHKPDNQYPDGSYYPWSDREIAHKISEAERLGYEGTPGDLLDDWHRACTELAQMDFSHAWEGVSMVAKTETTGDKIRFIGWDEDNRAAEDQQEEWLVPNWLEFGSLGMICGDPFSGKSCIVAELMASLAKWGTFGPLDVPQVPVMLIDLENKPRIRIGRLKRASEDDGECYRGKYCRVGLPSSAMPLDPEKIEKLIAHFRRATGQKNCLVVIDTFRSAFAADEKDTQQMVQLLYPLQQVAQRQEAAILVLHHRPKSGASYSGDSSIMGAMDYFWLWESDADTRIGTLTLKGTRGEPQEPMRFLYTEAGRNVYQADRSEGLEAMILRIVESEDQLQSEIVRQAQSQWVGDPPGVNKIRATIQNLESTGQLQSRKAGKHGKTYGLPENQ